MDLFIKSGIKKHLQMGDTTTNICSNQISKIEHNNLQYFDSNRIMDMIISNLIVSKLGDVMKESFTINPQNVLKLLVLLSLGEIKDLSKVFISGAVSYLKNYPQILFFFIRKIFQYRRPVPLQHVIVPIGENTREINISVDFNFMKALYNYIKNSKKCTHNKILCGINIKNMKEQIFEETIFDMRFNLDNTNIICNDNIKYGINIINNEIHYVIVQNQRINSNQIDPNYAHLLTPEQKKIIDSLEEHYLKIHKSYAEITKQWMPNRPVAENCFTEVTIANLICEKYRFFDRDRTLVQIIILCHIIYRYTDARPTNDSLRSLYKSKKMMFDSNIYTVDTSNWISEYITYKQVTTFDQDIISLGIKQEEFKHFRNFQIKDPTDTNSNDNKFGLVFVLSPSSASGKDDLDLLMKNFFSKINKRSLMKNKNKVKINFLRLEKEVKIVETSNPEYDAWNEKKQMIQSLKISKEDFPIDFITFINSPIPPKTIKKEESTIKIESKQLNEIEKDITTLYLRKNDRDRLLSCLSQFRDKKYVLQNLGLQNKLNVLLYGLPGTGKTTTIQAIATYLQKDIYYVDLKNARCNYDLQLMFEWVNKHVPNGGIIVMEDIDAMTDVVLKRSENFQERSKVVDLVNDQENKLTLEYFLNILQGTLTLDDSIFITTTNYIDHLDPAFYRDGRFDVKIELKLCDHYQITMIYDKILSRQIPRELLKRIPEDKFSPATIIYHVKNYLFCDNETSDETILEPFLS